MLYNLPDGPPMAVIDPHDTAWWAALGQPSAGRHALVIGDPTTPTTALVIAGAITDLRVYLHPLHSTLVATVQAAYIHHTQQFATGTAPVTAGPQPDADLITLPHTGIRVPNRDLRVTAMRELPTPDGVAYTATLRLDGAPVGTAVNESMGGETNYLPAPGSPLGDQQLAVFVAASRGVDGQPLAIDELLDVLTEYENAKEVAKAVRAGRSPLRLRAPLGEGPELADTYYTARHATAAKVTTPAQRDALVADLRRRGVAEGTWWQLWTGERWDNPTPPPTPDPGAESPW